MKIIAYKAIDSNAFIPSDMKYIKFTTLIGFVPLTKYLAKSEREKHAGIKQFIKLFMLNCK